MVLKWFLLCALGVSAVNSLSAEIIDRIAVTVGDQVITESEILLQIRLTAFLNKEPADVSSAEKRRSAERLVDQALLAKEMEVSRFPEPAMAEVTQELADLKKERFQDEAQYRNELSSRGIKEDELRHHLQWQMRVLRFIEFRFGAGVQVTETDIKTYYQDEFVREWAKGHQQPAPPVEDVTEEIEEVLSSRKVDVNTEEWLKQGRSLARIKIYQEAFQ